MCQVLLWVLHILLLHNFFRVFWFIPILLMSKLELEDVNQPPRIYWPMEMVLTFGVMTLDWVREKRACSWIEFTPSMPRYDQQKIPQSLTLKRRCWAMVIVKRWIQTSQFQVLQISNHLVSDNNCNTFVSHQWKKCESCRLPSLQYIPAKDLYVSS